jgi:hypothetical protein
MRWHLLRFYVDLVIDGKVRGEVKSGPVPAHLQAGLSPRREAKYAVTYP